MHVKPLNQVVESGLFNGVWWLCTDEVVKSRLRGLWRLCDCVRMGQAPFLEFHNADLVDQTAEPLQDLKTAVQGTTHDTSAASRGG